MEHREFNPQYLIESYHHLILTLFVKEEMKWKRSAERDK